MLIAILQASVRSAAGFVIMLILTRLLGPKAISEMTYFDIAAMIILGAVTAEIGIGAEKRLVPVVSSLLTFAGCAIITDYLHLFSFRFQKLAESEPLVVMQNGEIVKANMRKARITLTQLTALLREKDCFNIADVNFAVMEKNGKLSVLLRADKSPLTPFDMQLHPMEKGLCRDIIIDGNVMYDNLNAACMTEQRLLQMLRERGFLSAKEVFYAGLDSAGNLFASKGIEGNEKPGQHGIE